MAGIIGALILLAGIVVDGGLALGARVRAINEAQEAARSGAQQLDLAAYRRDGRIRPEPVTPLLPMSLRRRTPPR
ncbi:hypothetical protein [Streptosporangium sp. NPDC049376]|uniref:hypothetical protein n=1 Tax=Streptosporangium sp. NPDC049376 TaxID=3366192 RepID=UPI0037B41D93